MGGGSRNEPVADVGDEDGLLVAARWDPEAFGKFYDQTSDSILRYFYARTACSHTAADLCAETYAQALSGVHRYRVDAGPARSWLFGIARHLFHQYLRREAVSTRARRRLGIPTEIDDRLDHERIETLVDLVPLAAKLADAVDSLTPALRDAVILRVVDELPYEELAARLGCTPGSARVRVSRALHQIADRLEAQP